MIESAAPFSLLGNMAGKDRQAEVPDIWRLLGQEITSAMMKSYPLSKPRGNRPQVPLPGLEYDAPASGGWYEEQGARRRQLMDGGRGSLLTRIQLYLAPGHYIAYALSLHGWRRAG